ESANFELHCPLLEKMLNHSLNKDTHVNLLVVSVLGLVSCLGILENALVLWVLGFRLRRKTVAAVWVINLALSDFLATLTLPLFTYYFSVGHSWELGQALCSAEASIFFLNMYVSAFLLAAISLDRCLLVVKPVWSQNQRTVEAAWKVCLLGWLWAGFNTVPYFLFRNVTVKRDKRKLCYHNFALYSSPATLEFDCKLRQAATAVSKALLAFLVPLVVIASRFTKMVASVIATFALCWAPYHFFCLLEVAAQYFPSESYLVKLVEQGLPLSSVFAFLNPVLNPIIYTFSCPHFCTRIRQSLGLLFEGLVEEAGPLVLATSRIIRRDPNSPTSPSSLSSPTTPTLLRLPRLSQGSNPYKLCNITKKTLSLSLSLTFLSFFSL
uniref:Prostaglandin D2 receptor 2 n=1 Tax=Astyanax mexicanus TaxID=7994 RepID=A0A8B9LKM4_ASTMX